MYHAGFVGAVQSVARFHSDFQQLIGRQRTAGNPRRQSLALKKLHHQGIRAVLVTHVEKLADARMG